jgi:hypothetical protein
MTEMVLQGEVVLDLPSLADEANREHLACGEAVGSVLEHAWRAGRALAQVKAGLAHGEFLPWLEENFNGSQRHAYNYMKLADEENLQRVTTLADEGASIRSALRELSANSGEPVGRAEEVPEVSERQRKRQRKFMNGMAERARHISEDLRKARTVLSRLIAAL